MAGGRALQGRCAGAAPRLAHAAPTSHSPYPPPHLHPPRAAKYHKSAIDNLLHPKAAGATPYRVVLGDVSAPRALCTLCVGAPASPPRACRGTPATPRPCPPPTHPLTRRPARPPDTRVTVQVRQRLLHMRRRMEEMLGGQVPNEEGGEWRVGMG